MKLRTFNNILSLIVICFGLYITVSPFLPELAYLLRDRSVDSSVPYGGELARQQGSNSTSPPPDENRIVIPSIQINEPILEGNNINVINRGGTWRRPNTADPTKDNNTVIVGHRFFGNNVSTFYHLDKVEVGQMLALYWDKKETLYQVTEKKIVDASAVEIEAPTSEKQLTLYTCDPIWTAKNRLVIIARPVTINKQINGEEL